MASVAKTVIQKEYKNIPIEIKAIHEPRERAFGVGTAIM